MRRRIESLEQRFDKMDDKFTSISSQIAALQSSMNAKFEDMAQNNRFWSENFRYLIKFVIFPLVVILGGVAGIKILWPTA